MKRSDHAHTIKGKKKWCNGNKATCPSFDGPSDGSKIQGIRGKGKKTVLNTKPNAVREMETTKTNPLSWY